MNYSDELLSKGWNAKLRNDYETAVKYFKEAADLENDQAQYKLGVCYFYGDGVSEDRSTAMYWFAKAALHNNTQAFDAIESILENMESKELVFFGQDLGNQYQNKTISNINCIYLMVCAYILGYRFVNGSDGLPKDMDSAISLLGLSAVLGFQKASTYLSKLRK